MKLADRLCNQYKQFYIKCRGKDAYLNFQIQWYDFLRCVASGAEMKLSKDSQVIDSDYEETSTFNLLLLLCLVDVVSSDTIASCVSEETTSTIASKRWSNFSSCHTSSLVLSIHGNPAPHTMLTALHCIKHVIQQRLVNFMVNSQFRLFLRLSIL